MCVVAHACEFVTRACTHNFPENNNEQQQNILWLWAHRWLIQLQTPVNEENKNQKKYYRLKKQIKNKHKIRQNNPENKVGPSFKFSIRVIFIESAIRI